MFEEGLDPPNVTKDTSKLYGEVLFILPSLQIHSGDINEDEMGGTCSKNDRMRNTYKIKLKSPEVKRICETWTILMHSTRRNVEICSSRIYNLQNRVPAQETSKQDAVY
jgi:hypothetical protein